MPRRTRHLTRRVALSPDDPFPGLPSVGKKRQLFPELPSAFPISSVLPDNIHVPVVESYPHYLSRKAARPALIHKNPVPLRAD